MTTTTTTPKQSLAEQHYLAAYARAMAALKAVEQRIHDNPAPDGEIKIHFGHVGDMTSIAQALEAIAYNA